MAQTPSGFQMHDVLICFPFPMQPLCILLRLISGCWEMLGSTAPEETKRKEDATAPPEYRQADLQTWRQSAQKFEHFGLQELVAATQKSRHVRHFFLQVAAHN